MTKFVTKQNKFLKSKINPLYTVCHEMMSGREQRTQKTIINYYRSLGYTFDFLEITIQRIIYDIEFNQKYWDVIYRRYNDDLTKDPLTVEEKDVLSREIEAGNSIFLDVSIFYIYAKILMDQIANLVCAFYDIQPHKSFRKHRKFIDKHDFHDIKYKKFIKNMDWFIDFQDIRDDHIIHPYSITWGYSMSGPTLTSIGKGPITSKDLTPLIDNLKEKHLERILELKTEKNYFIIMEIFRKNKEKISPTELGQFIELSKKWHRNFYSIDGITDKIFEYVDFINSHFVQNKIVNPITKKPLK